MVTVPSPCCSRRHRTGRVDICRAARKSTFRLKIANDEGVDEELLARAFRAALPALRKLSHPNDKACEIFQAYVALKNGRNYVAHNSA
ncbi:hypothetical protein TNCV_1209701 [Trichonephila clavipes]|nr:hypothetical protein TNCV_1209701 [Trichonephila clavipes]